MGRKGWIDPAPFWDEDGENGPVDRVAQARYRAAN
jgi:hypothetical protein